MSSAVEVQEKKPPTSQDHEMQNAYVQDLLKHNKDLKNMRLVAQGLGDSMERHGDGN